MVVFVAFLPNNKVRVWIFSSGVEDTLLPQICLSSLYLHDSNFSGVIWIDKLHDCDERVCFCNNVSIVTGKRDFFSYDINGC